MVMFAETMPSLITSTTWPCSMPSILPIQETPRLVLLTSSGTAVRTWPSKSSNVSEGFGALVPGTAATRRFNSSMLIATSRERTTCLSVTAAVLDLPPVNVTGASS